MGVGLVIVVGLRREARIADGRGRVIIGGSRLRGALDDAVGLVSFGVCGALDPALTAGDLIIADGVGHSDRPLASDPAWTAGLRAALPGSRGGLVAGGEVIVGSVAAKAALRQQSGAAVVDMESRAVAVAARDAGLPFVVIRAVSDTAGSALPRAAQAGFKADGAPDVGAVIASLLRRPWELPALIRTAVDAEKAFKALESAALALTLPPL